MEVSSQSMKMHRVDGLYFDIGLFTNISPDHIGPDEHEILRNISIISPACCPDAGQGL